MFWYAWSLLSAGSIVFIANPIFALTIPKESFPKDRICGTRTPILSGDIIFKKFLNDFTASIFTSISLSFSRFPRVWIRLISVTSLPKFWAIYVKFFDRQSLTRHDLSSAAWIIKGMMKVLFSSLVRILDTSLKDSVANTRIWSCSSVDLCFKMPIKSESANSFS